MKHRVHYREGGMNQTQQTVEVCDHEHAEPVDLLVTGERVGWVCPDCDEDLPADWEPPKPEPPRTPLAPYDHDVTHQTLWGKEILREVPRTSEAQWALPGADFAGMTLDRWRAEVLPQLRGGTTW